MAEDIRDEDPSVLLKKRRAEIQVEAIRQMDSCLYTSTMIYLWLKPVRWQHKAVILVPLILTAIVGFSYVQNLVPAWTVALMGFFATLIPAIAKALDIETHVEELKRCAADYKGLQDRFRQLAKIGTTGDIDEAEVKLAALMDRMDTVRGSSITPPERYFKKAQQKIKSGHYEFSVDMDLRDAAKQELVAPLGAPA